MADIKKKSVEFANFQGTLGGSTGLIEQLTEILLPAFLDEHIFPDAKALPFYLADVVIVPSPINNDTSVAICGRYIVKKKFIKTQDYDPSTKKRKKAHGILEDYPSAIFWLDLSTHHLAYVKETLFAPTIKNFESACNVCLRCSRKKHIENSAIKDHPNKYGRGKLIAEYSKKFPNIDLNIVPFHSKHLLEQAFSRIVKLQHIDLAFVADNATLLNLRPLQKEILAAQKDVSTDSISKHSLSFTAVGRDSTLDKDGTKAVLDEIAGKGYGVYKFRGKDNKSETVKGDSQDNVTLRDHIDLNTEQPMSVIAKLLGKFYTKQMIPNNTLITSKVQAAITSIRTRLNKRQPSVEQE